MPLTFFHLLMFGQGRVKKKSEKKTRQPDLPPLPKLDQEPLTSSEEDIPMYFTNQGQLLDIFQARFAD